MVNTGTLGVYKRSKMKKGLKAVFVLILAGLILTANFFREKNNKTIKSYDELQRKYDSAILANTKVLEESKLKRDSLVRNIDSLTNHYEVLIRTLKSIPKPRKFDNLTNKELENLMIDECRKKNQK